MHSSRRRFLAAASITAASPLFVRPQELLAATRRDPDVPWLEETQRPPDKPAAELPKLAPVLVDDAGQPITSLDGWKKRRGSILADWRKFLGYVETPREPPRLSIVAEDREAGVLRQLVSYDSEPGVKTMAYLIRPLEVSGKPPGVVVLHSTVDHTIRQPAGLDGPAAKFFGLRMAQAGMITFSPRNYLWTDKGFEKETVDAFKQRHLGSQGMAKMLYDAQQALDILLAQGADPSRLGAVGHSLGAKESLYLAAFDERVRATVSSEGGIGVSFSNWEAPWYLGPDVKEGRWTRDHQELLALVAPRPFLLVGGDSADGDPSWPYIAAALDVYKLYGSPQRVGLYNHRQGHSVPPEAEARIDQWLKAYLSA